MCDGLHLVHDLYATDEREMHPVSLAGVGLLGHLLLLRSRLLLLGFRLLGDALDTAFEIIEITKGKRLLAHIRYSLICSTIALKACSTAAFWYLSSAETVE